ncbi:FBD-associated F-box protein At5g60610-like isoform X2 [Carex rostrata]
MMEGGDFARDRISGLPDPLLTHILSFLPTEEAVRTCILAKRWIKVWASLPVLIFDDPVNPYDNLTKEEYRTRDAKFLRFIGGIIFHREKLTLDTFKLTWWGIERDTLLHVFEFLCYAVECRPRILSIHIDECTFFDLPNSICTSTSVEEMSLWLFNDDCLEPRTMILPSLKKLELRYLFYNDDIMRMLISGCPILEELVLIECYMEVTLISSNVLKKLVLINCRQHWPMEISCPGVVSLSITSISKGGITLKNMSSLATADILFEEYAGFSLGTLDHDLRLLSGLSNVTSLKLYTRCTAIMDLLLADIPNCPILKNLTSLDLGVLDFNYDWDLVACLLQHSSNLKDLTLHLYQSYDSDEGFQQEISFQHDFLEAMKIICPGKNVKLAEELVHNIKLAGELYDMDELVTTAKIIIL